MPDFSRTLQILGLILGLSLCAAAQAPATDRLAPDLAQRMAQLVPGERVAAYASFAARLDPSSLEPQLRGLSRREHRRALSSALKEHAATQQRTFRAALQLAEEGGTASLRRVLWMANTVLFEAERELVEQLAELPGVERVGLVRDLPAESQQDIAPPRAPGLGSYPLYDDFESGVLGAHWTVASSGHGYVLVSPNDGPLESHHVVMASSQAAQDSTASLTVQLDLRGESDVGLRFWHKEFGDENHAEDGVFLSAGGGSWQRVISLEDGEIDYAPRWVALDPILASFTEAQRADIHLRFQWRDDFDVPSDGMAFDRIEIGPGVAQAPAASVEPNIANQQAPQLWALGFSGDGVLIGSIDSGVQRDHPDLVGQLWTNPGEIADNDVDDDANGFIDDVQGWDFMFDDNDVTSGDPHGTQSAGLMVGDGAGGRATGMAPGAQLVVCRVNNAAQYWEAQQYLFELGVDVLSSSYSYKWVDQPDYHVFRALTDVELAGGVSHANSIGNQGLATGTHPVPFNISAPGNAPSPFDHPEVLSAGRSSVMACGAINLSSGTLNILSGIGPSAWEELTLYDPAWPHAQDSDHHDYPFGGFAGPGPGLLKPDMVSYTNVMTTATGGGYSNFSGTSASTPQLGGALALLREVQPDAQPRHLDAALQLTAVDLGAPGKDVNHGAGLVAAYAAARRLVLLLTAEPQTVSIGQGLDLHMRGEPDANVYLLLAADVQPGATLNMTTPFKVFPPRDLGPSGALTLPVVIPNDPMLVGVTVWLQAAAPSNGTSVWGPTAFFSVPESVSFDI